MLITQSVDGVPIRLTTERWEHICRRYDEKKKKVVGLTVLGLRARLLESIKEE